MVVTSAPSGNSSGPWEAWQLRPTAFREQNQGAFASTEAALDDMGKRTESHETFHTQVQHPDPQNHYAPWKKANIKEHMLYGPINMKCPKKAST